MDPRQPIQPVNIGLYVGGTDPFWVQVQEAIYQRAEHLGLDLVPIAPSTYFLTQSTDEHLGLIEELLAQELTAQIGWPLPEHLAHELLDAGLPIIHLSETEIEHRRSVSPLGLYDAGYMLGEYTARRLDGRGLVLVVGGLQQDGMADDGRSRVAGISDALSGYPKLHWRHTSSQWNYPAAVAAVEQITGDEDAILGLSDSLALWIRDLGHERGLIKQSTFIGGINGDPQALAAIIHGELEATVNIFASDLGARAIDLALAASRGDLLPAHFHYRSQLVTRDNVAEMAAQKLIDLAALPDRLRRTGLHQQQQRLIQLETSLKISRRFGSILEPRRLSEELADLIRIQYGFDRANILLWQEHEQTLVQPNDVLTDRQADPIPIGDAPILHRALSRNEPIFIPDALHSSRFAPDPDWPKTRTRIVLPIRRGEEVTGLLDLHSFHSTRHLRQEMIGLQTLADQVGTAMHNALLYSEALEAREAAERAERLKTRLLANVSHELRSPLNVILGYTRAESDPVLARIQTEAQHLLHLINDLLDLSRAEIGALELTPQMLDLRQLLHELFDGFIQTGDDRDTIRYRLFLPGRLPLVQADPIRIRQIVLNLLDNARRFTRSGTIVLGAKVNFPQLHIWVEDTGSGIAPEQLDAIFEPFATGAGSPLGLSGIGLGLAIARRLTELHHGTMTIESQVNTGSTFHIYLPLPNLTDASIPPPQGSQPVLLLLAGGRPVPPEIQRLCQAQNLAVTPVDHDTDIKALLTTVKPAAVAWDAAGAGIDSWVLMARLRSHPFICRLPFILYGQSHDPGVGTINILTKPVASKTLAEIFSSLGPDLGHGSILVVDDDPLARQHYCNLITQGLPGYRIRTADGGDVAWSLMNEETPSLVLLDLTMPRVDGFEVLRRMRQSEVLASIPVLVLTGRVLTMDDVELLRRHPLVTLQSKEVLSGDELIDLLCRSVTGASLPSHTSLIVKQAIAYIHEHYAEPIARPQMARAVGVNESYLSQIVRQEIGLSLWEFLIRYRIHRAKQLLRDSSHSIAVVANRTGFNDPAYFSRVFKKHVGMSPRTYRS